MKINNNLQQIGTSDFSQGSSKKVAYAVSISVGILVGLALVAGLLVYFFRPIKLNIELPAGLFFLRMLRIAVYYYYNITENEKI